MAEWAPAVEPVRSRPGRRDHEALCGVSDSRRMGISAADIPPSLRRTQMKRAVLALTVLVSVLVAPRSANATPLPSSIAGLGDSITRAADVCCWYGDHPGQSWSTGYTSYDGIASHYERLAALNSAINGHEHNDAVSGAKARDLSSQVSNAVAQQAQYVTVLIGGNDLCTSSVSTMTSTADFATQIKAALDGLNQGLPSARIFVSSIPDIYQLWSALHTNWLARLVWSTAHICQSMLASTNTEAQRQQVVTREAAFNQILAQACANHTNCRWDQYATYNYKFSASQVSTLDYFHPSLSGQAALARVTWNASYWAG
jgi:lysophospholipase L1-like esterase